MTNCGLRGTKGALCVTDPSLELPPSSAMPRHSSRAPCHSTPREAVISLSLTKSSQFARRWLAITCGWIVFGLFNATESSVIRSLSGPVNYKLFYEFSLLDAFGWFLLTPVILWIAPRRLRVWQQLLIYLVAGVAIALAHLWILSRVLPFIG